MKKIRILVSLTTNDNNYQIEQANSAGGSSPLNIQVQIVYAENDAINQSTHLLARFRRRSEIAGRHRVQPFSRAALPQVAKAAVAANIGWAVLIAKLHIYPNSPHLEDSNFLRQQRPYRNWPYSDAAVRRSASPRAATYLHTRPSENSAAKEDAPGRDEHKAANIQITSLKGQWTEESSTRTVRSSS